MSYDANDRDDEQAKRERCRCGDMPGRCPGVRNCPLEAKDEEEGDDE